MINIRSIPADVFYFKTIRLRKDLFQVKLPAPLWQAAKYQYKIYFFAGCQQGPHRITANAFCIDQPAFMGGVLVAQKSAFPDADTVTKFTGPVLAVNDHLLFRIHIITDGLFYDGFNDRF